jgi:hypothetical protein
MTSNNTVFKLQQAQDQLSFIAQHLNNLQNVMVDLKIESEMATQRINELLPILESASHDVAWQDAQKVDTPSPALSTPKDIIEAFKAMASGQTKPGTTPTDLTDSLKASIRPAFAPQTSSVKAGSFVPGLSSANNLTDEARALLNAGYKYFEAIEALHNLHKGAQRDNIRRAVARAQGR